MSHFASSDAVAVARLELVGDRTVALVNLNALFVVDKTKDVISGDGVAAMAELILTDVVVVDEDGFFAVEFLRNHKELLCGILFLRFVLSQERNQPPPSFLPLIIILALQFIKVFLSKQDGLLTQCL